MPAAKDLIAVARAELGVKESPAGSNKVKYNTWYYGREVSGPSFPWCMAFVQWCCDRAGVALPVLTASCTALMVEARKAGMWVTSGYREGDIVLYDWGRDRYPDHCGVVESVSGPQITAIEGNTAVGNDSNGGCVMERVRTEKAILGAVRPCYEEEPNMDNIPSKAHKEAVEWAVANGILTGGRDGDLMLSQSVTRQQLCTMLYRYAKLNGK